MSQNLFLEFHTVNELFIPLSESYRLDSDLAVEIQTTIVTAAIAHTLDARVDSSVQRDLAAIKKRNEESMSRNEVSVHLVQKESELQAKVDSALAWMNNKVTVVLVNLTAKSIVWQGDFKPLVERLVSLAQDQVKLTPSNAIAKLVSGYPMLAPPASIADDISVDDLEIGNTDPKKGQVKLTDVAKKLNAKAKK